jgi:Zn-dependent alcohol dehydrogenase
MEVKAAVIREPAESHDFFENQPASFETVELEAPGPGEVLVEMSAASLCHTDVSITLGEIEEQYPMVMGHEGAGIVRETGESVDSVQAGDHVVLGRIACGRCSFCRAGQSNLCAQRTASREAGSLRNGEIRFRDPKTGEQIHHCHGVSSFASHTVVNEEVAVKIRGDIPLEKATLLGCGVFTGFGAVANTAAVEPGSTAAIFGVGGVGLSAVQAATLCGVPELIAVDVVPEKLDLAKQLGATHTVDAAKENPVARLNELSDGVDYVFDAVGATDVIEQASKVLAPTGEIVLIGTPPGGERSLELDLHEMILNEQSIIGSFNGSYNLPLAIPMLADLVAAGMLDLDRMISDGVPLTQLNEAMTTLEEEGVIRQVIVP